jgi:hypothetical protein
MGRCDPGDQFFLKIQSDWNHFKSNGCISLIIVNPTQLVWVKTEHHMREISHSVQINKQTKKNVLTIQSVQSIQMLTCQGRMTHGRAVRHVEGPYDTWQVLVGNRVDELAYDTWLVCGKWDVDMWPNQWLPCVT